VVSGDHRLGDTPQRTKKESLEPNHPDRRDFIENITILIQIVEFSGGKVKVRILFSHVDDS
jgi:hypothetical protein